MSVDLSLFSAFLLSPVPSFFAFRPSLPSLASFLNFLPYLPSLPSILSFLSSFFSLHCSHHFNLTLIVSVSLYLSLCRGDGLSVFSRATLSADGRLVACGTTNTYETYHTDQYLHRCLSNRILELCSIQICTSDTLYLSFPPCFYFRADRGCSRIRFWDSQTGHTVPSSLSDLLLPYPVRSISWHPTQHMMAVAMVRT